MDVRDTSNINGFIQPSAFVLGDAMNAKEKLLYLVRT